MKKQKVAIYKISQFWRNNIWWLIPLLFTSIFALYFTVCFFNKPELIKFDKDKVGVFVGAICGTSGFFIAVTGFFLALSKENEITKRFFKTKHPKIMLMSCILGLLLSFISLLTYLLFDYNVIVIFINIAAIAEFFIVIYYIYYLFKQYISVETDLTK